jgi:D-3-phosphoglycerate dehydrogenase
LESFLDGHLLFIDHLDKPGVIGEMGTTLGKYHINISSMSLGRAEPKPGGDAVAVLSLDDEPTPESLKEVSTHQNIQRVYFAKLPTADKLPAWMG